WYGELRASEFWCDIHIVKRDPCATINEEKSWRRTPRKELKTQEQLPVYYQSLLSSIVPIRAEYFSEYWEMAAVVALEGTVGNGMHKPAREQLKIMARFIAQNVEFGVTLEGEDKWAKLLRLLHAKDGCPKFGQRDWEQIWINKVQEMLRKLTTFGKGLLDSELYLIYIAHNECSKYAEQKRSAHNEELTEDSDMEIGSNGGIENSDEESSSEDTQTDCEDNAFETNGTPLTNFSSISTPHGGKTCKIQENERLERLKKKQSVLQEQRVHPFRKAIQKSPVKPSKDKVGNVTPGQQLLITLRSQLSMAAEKLRQDTQKKLTQCKEELESMLEDEMRPKIHKGFEIMMRVVRQSIVKAVEDSIEEQVEMPKPYQLQNTFLRDQGGIFKIAEGAAGRALVKLDEVSLKQYSKLIDLMEKYGLVARGRIAQLGARGNKYTEKKWDEFAVILNTLGRCQKNGKGWKQYWKQCRLQSRRNKARFLKAYHKTGHNKPVCNITKEDERICNIFGDPGLGFAIIRECGFPKRKSRPTRYQMETMCYYIIQEPGFGIDLKNKVHWEKLLKILDSTMGPKFEQDQWRDFWFSDTRSMLECLKQVGVEGLDNHSTLVHQAYIAVRDYAEVMSAEGIYKQLGKTNEAVKGYQKDKLLKRIVERQKKKNKACSKDMNGACTIRTSKKKLKLPKEHEVICKSELDIKESKKGNNSFEGINTKSLNTLLPKSQKGVGIKEDQCKHGQLGKSFENELRSEIRERFRSIGRDVERRGTRILEMIVEASNEESKRVSLKEWGMNLFDIAAMGARKAISLVDSVDE
ncbi:hypothetical protein QAD02_019811, partial [Eretmocerus hayati]